MAERVAIFEVGPRDGLQNEQGHVETHDKIKLVQLLAEAGLHNIEAASFVSPKWVPQMADSDAVIAGLAEFPKRGELTLAALTPNERGYERAKSAGVDVVAVFGSASEGFSKANINCSIDESFERFAPVLSAARSDAIPVRGYISCVIACPYDGPTDPRSVEAVAARLMEMGCSEVSLGDTIGAGTPETVTTMLKAVRNSVPVSSIAGHYHDTNGNALANVKASLDVGIRAFDTAIGGLGGCPYAPGAKGNVATEAVVDLLEHAGFSTGVDTARLAIASTFAQSLRGARDA